MHTKRVKGGMLWDAAYFDSTADTKWQFSVKSEPVGIKSQAESWMMSMLHTNLSRMF